MKLADYVSKYLKESYGEQKAIENEDEAKKAIEDLKDFFEMGEDEDNEFGDDLDKMLMSMDSGEEVDDDLDFDELDFDEGKDSKKDCPGCKTTKVEKYCADCGTKNEGDDLEERENREDEGDRNFPDKRSKKRGYDDDDDLEERKYDDDFAAGVGRSGHSDGYDDDDDDEYDEDGIPKYPDPMRGRTRPGQRRLYSSKNYKMTEMEKKLEEYREGKKNKKGFKPRGVVDAGDSSDGE
jgi:hypothetical protein